MLETSTSPAPARAATRAPMWTAIPPTSSPISSLSPVCRPARISMPSVGDAVAGSRRAADRPRRPVERGEEAVAGRVDLVAAEALELAAHDEWCASSRSRQRRSPSSAACSVEPTMSVNRTVASTRSGSGAAADAGEELLDLVEQRVLVADPRQVVVAGQLDEAARRGSARRGSGRPRRNGAVAGAVEDERRHADRRQDVADVDLGVHPRQRDGRAGARAHAQVASPTSALNAGSSTWLGARASRPTGPPQSRCDLREERLVLLGGVPHG